MEEKATEKFIESWGMLGSVWGINTSMARVHALLIVSEGPVSLDEAAKRLGISRGNASMCLRELRNWGVIKLVKKGGDRQDYYITEQDVWKMFFSIARERKRREFDPALEVVRDTISTLRSGADGEVESRLKEMEKMLVTLDGIAEKTLASDELARYALNMLSKLPWKKDRPA